MGRKAAAALHRQERRRWRCRTVPPRPPEWPVPQLRVPADEIARWRQANGLGTGPGHCPGPRLGRRLQALDLLSGSRAVARRARLRRLGGRRPRREGAGASRSPQSAARGSATSPAPTCAMARWRWPRPSVAISNDSGLMHIARRDRHADRCGIFGPTGPYLWAPLNRASAATVRQTAKSTAAVPAVP